MFPNQKRKMDFARTSLSVSVHYFHHLHFNDDDDYNHQASLPTAWERGGTGRNRSGQTPFFRWAFRYFLITFSRFGDGRAVLCSSVREAMAALGVKTINIVLHMKPDFLSGQCLGANQQGSKPGGGEGQGGKGNVLWQEDDDDGTLCCHVQNRSHLVQVRVAPIYNL